MNEVEDTLKRPVLSLFFLVGLRLIKLRFGFLLGWSTALDPPLRPHH